MNELEQAAANVKELAEKIVRCAERLDSYQAILDAEAAELERLKDDHRKAKKALIFAAQGNTLRSIAGIPE